MKTPRIYLIHATPVAIAPITEAFTRLWPDAKLANLLEDSLSTDLAEVGTLTKALNERFLRLASYAADSGADAILFTCSAFGDAIDLCKRALTIPVLKPNEAMIEAALQRSRKICIVATFQPAISSMTEEFHSYAKEQGIEITLNTALCPGALDELRKGNAARHDEMIAEAVKASDGSELLCFAQFSMTSAADQASENSGLPVLTTPDSAVLKLKRMLDC